MNSKNLKLLGYVAIGIMVLNMIFFALQKISGLIFWIIIILGAFFVYKVLPILKK